MRTARDFDAGRDRVASIGGNPAMFRPPYGKLTLIQWLIERQRGSHLGWWSIDSRDSWDRRPIAAVVDEVLAAGGGVVLMHDYDQYGLVSPQATHHDHVLELTRAIIEASRNAGLRILPMSELHACQ
jgi:peptidoglycan/xylan/chitin deacetylase (PgdA/CDA1 family)